MSWANFQGRSTARVAGSFRPLFLSPLKYILVFGRQPHVSPGFAVRELSLFAVLRDPERQLLFGPGSPRDREHRFNGVYLGCGKAVSVDRQKQSDAEESRPFVAVPDAWFFAIP